MKLNNVIVTICYDEKECTLRNLEAEPWLYRVEGSDLSFFDLEIPDQAVLAVYSDLDLDCCFQMDQVLLVIHHAQRIVTTALMGWLDDRHRFVLSFSDPQAIQIVRAHLKVN